jgi:hypothetical protein
MNDYLGDDKYVKKPRTKPEPEVVNRPLTQIQALGEVPGKTMGMRNGRTRAGLGGGNTRNKTKKNTPKITITTIIPKYNIPTIINITYTTLNTSRLVAATPKLQTRNL